MDKESGEQFIWNQIASILQLLLKETVTSTLDRAVCFRILSKTSLHRGTERLSCHKKQ